MKFLNILTLLLAAFLAYTSAQSCRGGALAPICRGPPSVGRRGTGCIPSTVWYYDIRSRQCRQLRYLGCLGNNNRWCTRGECQRRCRRR